MAVSTNSYFSNAIVGQTQIGADFNIYDVSTTPKYAVGLGFTRSDGAKFRYAHFGATTARGVLVSTDLSESQLDWAPGYTAALAANLTTPNGTSIAPNAINSQYLQLTITASAGQFAGGYVTIASGTGLGFQYRVKDNTATGNPVTGDCYLELYDKVQAAIDSNTAVQITGCPYANLEILDDSDDRFPAGVTVSNVSSSGYAWIQTGGVGTVLQDAVVGAVGATAFVSSNTDGAIMASVLTATSSNQRFATVGTIINPGTNANYSTVFLTLE